MRASCSVLTLMLTMSALLAASQPAPPEQDSSVDRVLDSIVAREKATAAKLRQYHPLVETYVQSLEPHADLGTVPRKDHYFLGRLGLSPATAPETDDTEAGTEEALVDLFKEFYAFSFRPDGFARMLVLDPESFDREHYEFEFVRREFLGEVRTLVFEVVPRGPAEVPGRFIGRIWVEDQDYSIVRYNGIYSSSTQGNLHFDSWRLNMTPGYWLPAYVYTEESKFRGNGQLKRKYKGQTRIWGFEIKKRATEEDFTKILVEASQATDKTDAPGDVSPVESQRAWEREAEDNVLRRLEKGGLLAPQGDVDEVLRTVVSNLEVTNGLDVDPPVRCRVLLTTPLESFTIGHTIVLSRGLIDVLPDESSLAMVLAHELGHVILGHQLRTEYAFSDQMLVGDKQAMEEFFFKRQPKEEEDADEKAMMILANSPYKDKGNAGLFLKALAQRVDALPALIRSHFGNRLAKKDRLLRMSRVAQSAPELYPTALNQIAALPLGGRVKVDPWTARIELMNNNKVVLLSPREKLPFEVTPLMPHLARLDSPETGSSATPEPAVSPRPVIDVGQSEVDAIAQKRLPLP